MKRAELVQYLYDRLEITRFGQDPSNNGLQVEGKEEISKIAIGVDATLEFFQKAAESEADFLFVHHGLSWGGGIRRLNGITGRRFAELYRNELSLFAVHLPLDAHMQLGNNAQLANILNAENRRLYFHYAGTPIGILGELSAEEDVKTIAERYREILGEPLRIFDNGRLIRKVGFISGGGGLDGLEETIDAGADLLVTGEVDHTMVPVIRESGIALLALGHYASETTGVQAVGRELMEQFGLECRFIPLPTGL